MAKNKPVSSRQPASTTTPTQTPAKTPDEKTPVIFSGRKGQGYRYCPPPCDTSTKGTRIDKCGKCGKSFPEKTTGGTTGAGKKKSDAIEAIRLTKQLRGMIEEMGGANKIKTMLEQLTPLANRCDGFDNIKEVLDNME